MRTTYMLAIVGALVGACAWGEGSPGDDPAPPDASSSAPFCGDGVCAASEIGVCTADCGGQANPVCGNQICEQGEDVTSCPSDCQQQATCGNNICEATESASSCPGDCGGGNPGTTCPADPFECFLCVAFGDPALCPPGLDPVSCQACLGVP